MKMRPTNNSAFFTIFFILLPFVFTQKYVFLKLDMKGDAPSNERIIRRKISQMLGKAFR